MNISSIKKDLLKIFLVLTYLISLVGLCPLAQAQDVEPLRADGDGAGAKITAITVLDNGATQTNMRQDFPQVGDQNWGCVKKPGSYVEVKVTTQPDTPEVWKNLKWGTGEEVPDGKGGFNDNCHRFSRSEAVKFDVKPTLNDTSPVQLHIWVIWGTYTIGLSGKTDEGQITEEKSDDTMLKPDGTWRDDIGGTNDLGPTDHCQNAKLTYSYSVGRTQGVVTLLPPGIGQVVRAPMITPTGFTLWNVRRHAWQKRYINGVATPGIDRDDASSNFCIDITPSKQTPDGQTDQGVDKLYDVDPPGGGLRGSDAKIEHTIEVYDNFDAWAEVTLDATYEITDHVLYNYQSQIDADNGVDGCYKVELNALATGNIPLPTTPHYLTRPKKGP